jgi:hypothetical protein
MASREQFLEDYEISCLLCDSDDSEDDRHNDDDILLRGSEDEEDGVEEDLDDDIDSMYDVADTGDHGEPANTDDEHSETGETQTRGQMFFKARTAPKVARAHRENIIVRLLGCA